MKSIRNLLTAVLLTAGAVWTTTAGISIASAADDAATAQPPAPPGPHGWHHNPWHLLGKLGLSAAQKQQIKDIMAAAHPQMQSLHEQMRANSLKIRQVRPTDPNYANVVSLTSQTHGTLSAQMMAQRAELRAQVFKVLTPEQQTQLTTLEAQSGAHKHGGWGGPPPPSER
jgi:periplasmic protein CpxP/Spy